MMTCKKIRELVLTDYSDAEASPEVREAVRAHLGSCSGCREFEQVVSRNALEPFKGIKAVQPPDEVWNGIREAIRQDQQPAVPLSERVFDLLGRILPFKKPVVAFTGVAVVVFAAVLILQLPLRSHTGADAYLREQAAFMLSLNTPANGQLEQEIGFGTAIEEFLF